MLSRLLKSKIPHKTVHTVNHGAFKTLSNVDPAIPWVNAATMCESYLVKAASKNTLNAVYSHTMRGTKGKYNLFVPSATPELFLGQNREPDFVYPHKVTKSHNVNPSINLERFLSRAGGTTLVQGNDYEFYGAMTSVKSSGRALYTLDIEAVLDLEWLKHCIEDLDRGDVLLVKDFEEVQLQHDKPLDFITPFVGETAKKGWNAVIITACYNDFLENAL